MLLEPEGAGVEVRRSPNIVAMKPQVPPPPVLSGRVVLKVGDGVSTDDILPAGPLTQHLRSNLPEISKFVFFYQDKEFPARSLAQGGGFIVGGENYGQGSSREHAALGPWQLGIRAVLARSFARIHCANLVNTGIVPLECDTSKIEQGDELEIDITGLRPGGTITVRDRTKGLDIPAVPVVTERGADIVRAGGLLAYTRARHG
jgi:aconitate hydratase